MKPYKAILSAALILIPVYGCKYKGEQQLRRERPAPRAAQARGGNF